MEIHHPAAGIGRVPLKSTGPNAPIRGAPHYCRPQNQWATDQETEKWEKEIQDIFSGEHDQHKFEEAEILEDSKDFPTHSGIQTPTLNAAYGNAKEPIQKSGIKPEVLESREEFPSLGKKMNEWDEKNKQFFGQSAPTEESASRGTAMQSQQGQQGSIEQKEAMPRHGVPLEEFMDNDLAGRPQQNMEGKLAECRSETSPGTGCHIGQGLKPQMAKKQGDSHKFEEADILEGAKEFPAHSGIQTPVLQEAFGGEPPLTKPEETDKEKKELKEVKGVIGNVKHAAEVVGEKIAHGAHEVKEKLTEAVHHLTTTTESNDSASKATEQTGYNTCA